MPPRVRACWLVIALLSLAPAGCMQSSDGGRGEGPGHREQALALSPDEEVNLGRKAYREILKDAQVVPNGQDAEAVQRVGRRIAKAVEIEPLQREINLRLKGYTFDWQFKLIRDDQVNAFCLPGGEVGVFTGLMRVVGSEEQLATVMSHEIAHALAHHASERIAWSQMQPQAERSSRGDDFDPGLIGILAAGAARLNSLKYERRQESEADHIGVFLMTFAGYDPEQAVVFWERMREQAGRGPHLPRIFSDHPADEQRIRDLRQWVPLAKGAKRAFDEGRIAPPPGRR